MEFNYELRITNYELFSAQRRRGHGPPLVPPKGEKAQRSLVSNSLVSNSLTSHIPHLTSHISHLTVSHLTVSHLTISHLNLRAKRANQNRYSPRMHE